MANSCRRQKWNKLRSSCKVPKSFVRFWPKLEFLDWFSQKFPKPNIAQIRPVGAALIHADRSRGRRKDAKLIGAFRDYAKTPMDNYVIRFWDFHSVCCLHNTFFSFLATPWEPVPVPYGKVTSQQIYLYISPSFQDSKKYLAPFLFCWDEESRISI